MAVERAPMDASTRPSFATFTRPVKGPKKMKTKSIQTGVAIAALLIATIAAQAADLRQPSYKAPAYSAPGFNWSGFYIGLNAGYGWGNASFSDPAFANFSTPAKGFLGGGTAGYNFQTGSWV